MPCPSSRHGGVGLANANDDISPDVVYLMEGGAGTNHPIRHAHGGRVTDPSLCRCTVLLPRGVDFVLGEEPPGAKWGRRGDDGSVGKYSRLH